MDKGKLEVGHLIRFHDWGYGGFLFGVIIEHFDDIYHSKLNIWRPKDIYFLQASGIDSIEVINNIKQVKDYELDRFQELLSEVKNNNIFCEFTA